MSVPESSSVGARCTLTCEVVDRQAIHYFFNGLPKRRRDSIRSHLAGCSRCRSKLEVFAKVWFLDGEKRKTRVD